MIRTGEIFVLNKVKTSFFTEDIEYKLEEINYDDLSVVMKKSIPESEPIIETLAVSDSNIVSFDSKIETEINDNLNSDEGTIEDAFNSFF